MTLKTLGMGIAKVVTKAIKKAKKSDTIKLGSAVAGVEVGRHTFNKAFGKDPHEGTITGIVKNVKKSKKTGSKFY